tara:strand:- start:304 stop:627 length:324 start_codon:yes stop_codon:yes gene_type:complete
MKTLNEKEKKLQEALVKLKNINFKNKQSADEVEILKNQKNQLEIEKTQLQEKFLILKNDYKQLKIEIDKLNLSKINEKKKEKNFEEKIDELNQETDSLLGELDKWQM